ncbi:MAG: chemotaxis protein CheX [Planctomycetaceae bacterium]|nr:chemotaxis protein CheX [Planctomycetaceae bacterium]
MSHDMLTADLDQIVEQIVGALGATMLDFEPVRCDLQAPTEWLAATVQIAGAWTGSVVVKLTPEFATYAAATMFQIDASDVTADDAKDTAGELANIVGGNLKSTLPCPSFLSLPTIVSGQELDIRIHGSIRRCHADFAAPSGTFRVELFEQSPAKT